AMAEIVVGPIRALGLIARTQLTPREIESIGIMVRSRLQNPFEFLKNEFEWAWEVTKPGDALSALASRNSESLFFERPILPDLSQIIARASIAEPMVASGELKRHRDNAFVDLMSETSLEPTDGEIDEVSKIKPWMIPPSAMKQPL